MWGELKEVLSHVVGVTPHSPVVGGVSQWEQMAVSRRGAGHGDLGWRERQRGGLVRAACCLLPARAGQRAGGGGGASYRDV